MDTETITCPSCGSGNIVGRGSRGPDVRLRCEEPDCHHIWVVQVPECEPGTHVEKELGAGRVACRVCGRNWVRD